MSDEWLQKAEAQRQRNERQAAPAEAERAAASKAFFEANTASMVDILRQWANCGSPSTHIAPFSASSRCTLGIPMRFESITTKRVVWRSGCLINITSPENIFGPHGAIGLLQPSIEIEAFANHFMVSLQDTRQGASTLDEVKALIADRWAKRQIEVSR